MQRFYVRCIYFVLYFSYRVEFFVAEANYNGKKVGMLLQSMVACSDLIINHSLPHRKVKSRHVEQRSCLHYHHACRRRRRPTLLAPTLCCTTIL